MAALVARINFAQDAVKWTLLLKCRKELQKVKKKTAHQKLSISVSHDLLSFCFSLLGLLAFFVLKMLWSFHKTICYISNFLIEISHILNTLLNLFFLLFSFIYGFYHLFFPIFFFPSIYSFSFSSSYLIKTNTHFLCVFLLLDVMFFFSCFYFLFFYCSSLWFSFYSCFFFHNFFLFSYFFFRCVFLPFLHFNFTYSLVPFFSLFLCILFFINFALFSC